MDLINEKVIHKIFGTGVVTDFEDPYIKIEFTSENKEFIYPDAFRTLMTFVDNKTNNLVKELIQKKENEIYREKLKLENEKALKQEKHQLQMQHEKLMKNFKIHPSSQAAFWCEEQELDSVFNDWKIYAGEAKSGKNQGKPNKLVRLHQNSACLLTQREPEMQEKERRIIGVFMVNETFIGKLSEDGNIPAHSKYRLSLSKEESEKMLFWNYYINERYPKNMTWNTAKYRYFDNVCMAQILKDIVAIKNDSAEKELAKEFFNHFCLINKISEKDIPEPFGVLKHI